MRMHNIFTNGTVTSSFVLNHSHLVNDIQNWIDSWVEVDASTSGNNTASKEAEQNGCGRSWLVTMIMVLIDAYQDLHFLLLNFCSATASIDHCLRGLLNCLMEMNESDKQLEKYNNKRYLQLKKSQSFLVHVASFLLSETQQSTFINSSSAKYCV